MSSTLRAIICRTTNDARRRAQRYAQANMLSVVQITRPALNTFNRSGGVMTNPVDSVVYDGPGRLRTVSGGLTYNLGGEPEYFAQTQLSIPLSAPRPQVNDDVLIVEEADATLIGRHYRITGVDSGGQLPTVHLCSLVGAEPAPNAT